ncbi:LuxR C-terminal-related transcriptional regulator [Pseudonocardia sp. RS11V-5]|uniref:response regulator transcription factor n=1 Tax=Pseudonocardia terrae TaxID=2905831 RepID=UPI001E3043DA|nr:LuxR C-terminal-related transcriptional regulator [Pseudonocardia terrae]MCE3553243.1 LuxR C-terminal-related transcriptional regulator [Pseudonocardia terrae]
MSPAAALSPADREEVRRMFGRLRRAAGGEPELRARLVRLQARLLEIVAPGPPTAAAATLSGREIDVLAHTALGLRNGETAALLGVSPETVKSYLRSAMTKLDAHSRHEAVARAREAGALP